MGNTEEARKKCESAEGAGELSSLKKFPVESSKYVFASMWAE